MLAALVIAGITIINAQAIDVYMYALCCLAIVIDIHNTLLYNFYEEASRRVAEWLQPTQAGHLLLQQLVASFKSAFC